MSKKEIIECSVEQLNTYKNRAGILVTREAKTIKLKEGNKEFIIVEKFLLVEE